MKRLFLPILIGACLANCTVENSLDSTECSIGEERCSGDVVQHCDNGTWIDWFDCGGEGMECVDESGEAQCTDGDIDTDTDSDTFYWPDWVEDFELYEPGDYITQVACESWTTWSDPPLPDEDAQVTDENSWSGKNSLRIVEGNDVVWMLEKTSGHWLFEFEMFVEVNRVAYYSFLSDSNSVGAFEMFFYPGGVGNMVISGKQFPFVYKQGLWFTASYDIDMDLDVATVSVDGTEVLSWPWSSGPPMHVDGINFYGIPDEPGSGYFVDDIRYRELD